MIKNMIFLTLIFIISGCGMMGSNSKKDDSLVAITENSDADENVTTNQTPLDNNDSLEDNEMPVDNNNSVDSNNTVDNNNSEDIVNINEPRIIVTKSNILPETISMEIPDVLKENNDTNLTSENNSTDDENKTVDKNSTIENIAYTQLKKDITQIENVVKIAQINLVLLKSVMPEVLDRCSGMSSCIFEKNNLSVVMDNETIDAIDNIIADNNFTLIDEYNNTNISLGELAFTRKDANFTANGYDYKLKLDMVTDDAVLKNLYKDNNSTDLNNSDSNSSDSNISERNFSISTVTVKSVNRREFQTFQWTNYNKNVTTNYLYEDDASKIDISIFYLVDDNGQTTMHVSNMSDESKAKKNMNLTLGTKEDDNSTLILQTNSIEQSIDGNDTNVSSFSTNGEISDDKSLILFSGTNAGEDNITTSKVSCDKNSTCDENSTIPDDINSNLAFHELNITNGNLTNGSFVLLAPYTEIEGLKLIDIFGLTLGTFTVFDNKIQGEIHNNNYNDMLDELTIIKINESEESTNLFEVITDENRPTIKIVDNGLID